MVREDCKFLKKSYPVEKCQIYSSRKHSSLKYIFLDTSDITVNKIKFKNLKNKQTPPPKTFKFLFSGSFYLNVCWGWGWEVR